MTEAEARVWLRQNGVKSADVEDYYELYAENQAYKESPQAVVDDLLGWLRSGEMSRGQVSRAAKDALDNQLISTEEYYQIMDEIH